MTVNAFVRKLDSLRALSQEDKEWLESISSQSRDVSANVDLIQEGEQPHFVQLVLDGFAVRYKSTVEGNRQIFAYLVPGDFCDLHVALLDQMDHSIGTVTPCSIVQIPRETIVELTERRPALTRAFWLCSLIDEATLREWLVNIGQRPADQRIAHLFCELHTRLAVIGMATDGMFELPISQAELGDTVGISPVHVNRSLRTLREEGLVTFRSERIVISDLNRLKRFAGFNPAYLHLLRRQPQIS